MMPSESNSGNNQKRILNEIVHLRAWHKPFRSGQRTVRLHVDVAFKDGRFATNDENPIPFSVVLDRAEVFCWIGESEQCEFVVGSAAITDVAGQIKTSTEMMTRTKTNIGLKNASLSDASGTKNRIFEKQMKIESLYWEFSENEHAWILDSPSGGLLRGRPWDAKKEPRISMRDRRNNVNDGLPPVVRVGIRCNVRDLKIDIDRSRFDFLIDISNNKLLAAKSYLKQALSKVSLPPEEGMENPHASIILADILVD